MAANKKPGGGISKRFWFVMHGWFAIPVWGGLLLICLTGTLCTVSQEITWLYKPEVRANPFNAEPRFDLVDSGVQKSYPGANIAAIHIDEPYLVYRVRIHLPDGQTKVLYINPYTGVVQGEAKGQGFRGFILALHGWLLFPWQNDYSLGWYLVTLLSIPLLGSLITSLFMLKRFWRFFYQPRLRLHKGRRVFWGDLHLMTGIWSIWFVAIISVSGLWFLLQGVLTHNQVTIYPQASALSREQVPVTTDSAPQMQSLEQLVTRAKATLPDLRISYIQFPGHAYDPVTVRGKRSGSLFKDNINAVYLNPYNGDTVQVHSPATVSFLHSVVALMAPLHFGDFAGLLSKLIWFFFGGLLCVMIGSGFLVWSARTLRVSKPRYRQANVLSGANELNA